MSFEDQIYHCSLGEKVFYSDWHKREPSLSFHDMLVLMAAERREHEKEEWERHLADEAYYAELNAQEAERERLFWEQEQTPEQEALATAEGMRFAEWESALEVQYQAPPFDPWEEEPELIAKREAREAVAEAEELLAAIELAR
jgi:hypothetical protein